MDDDEGEEKGKQTLYSRWRDAGKTLSEMVRVLSRGCARFGISTDLVRMVVDKIYSTWIEVCVQWEHSDDLVGYSWML